MKKITALLACLLLSLCLLPAAAFADVIWEPLADDFYASHYEDCEYLGRRFFANGEKGYVEVVESPESGVLVRSVENGQSFYVSFTYEKDGAVWGVVEYAIAGDGAVTEHYGGEGGESGWVDMAGLLLIYDNQSFVEEHEAEFSRKSVEFDAYEYGAVQLWTYPGSGASAGTINPAEESFDRESYKLSFDSVWTDENGREWAYVGYFYARRGWICLTEPESTELPVTEQSYELIPAASPAEAPSGKGETRDLVLVAALVVAVVIIAIALIRLLAKSKK